MRRVGQQLVRRHPVLALQRPAHDLLQAGCQHSRQRQQQPQRRDVHVRHRPAQHGQGERAAAGVFVDNASQPCMHGGGTRKLAAARKRRHTHTMPTPSTTAAMLAVW
jgi:hypothetical protein